MIRYVRGWLKQHRFVFAGCEDEAAAKIVDLAKQALGLTAVRLDVFQKLEEMRDEALQQELSATLAAEQKGETATEQQPKRRKALDLLAVPDEQTRGCAETPFTAEAPAAGRRSHAIGDVLIPSETTLFSMRCWHAAAPTSTPPA